MQAVNIVVRLAEARISLVGEPGDQIEMQMDVFPLLKRPYNRGELFREGDALYGAERGKVPAAPY